MFLKNKRTILIIIVLLGIVALFLLLSLFIPSSPQTPLQPSPEVNPSPYIYNSQGDTSIFESPQFTIDYQPQFNKYIISINSSPFDQIRTVAEAKFLEVSKLDRNTACNFSVVIVTPNYANPSLSGKEFPLSFCTPPTPTPSPRPTPSASTFIPVSSTAKDLAVNSIFPNQGTISIGGTLNSVFVTFNQAIDSTTAQIVVSPALKAIGKSNSSKPSQLNIIPTAPWQSNVTYTITVKAGLISKNKQYQLKNDLILKYTTTQVEEPEEDVH